MNYIYVFEDGQVGLSKTAPGNEDLLSIEDGRLEVLEHDGFSIRGIGGDGEYYSLPDADWYDETKQFHVIHD